MPVKVILPEPVETTSALYEDARQSRLGTDKFMSDGRHTGTGGGNESTIISFLPTLIHHGMIYVGLPYACPELADISEVKGGSPWGAATVAGADGSRQPSEKELAQARFQGKHVAQIAAKLNA